MSVYARYAVLFLLFMLAVECQGYSSVIVVSLALTLTITAIIVCGGCKDEEKGEGEE